MKKSKSFSISIVLILALLVSGLTSCNPETSYIKKVNNNSDYPFSVEYKDANTGQLVRKKVEAHSSTTIYYSVNAPIDDGSCINTLGAPKVIMESGLSLAIDIDLDRNWDTNVDQKKNGNTIKHTCIFEVNNSDFVE